jgi:hypothetical protein
LYVMWKASTDYDVGANDASSSSFALSFNICPSGDVQEPLDPFDDLVFTPLRFEEYNETSYPHYSSHHCVGTGTQDPKVQHEIDSLQARRPNYAGRSCWYRNLYYRLQDQTFHYLVSPIEGHLWKQAREAGEKSFVDFHSRMNVTLDHINDIFERKAIERFHGTPWRPEMHFNVQQPPTKNIWTEPKGTLLFTLSSLSQHELWSLCMGRFIVRLLFARFVWSRPRSQWKIFALCGGIAQFKNEPKFRW